jgi:lysophospholipase L1-like esterase
MQQHPRVLLLGDSIRMSYQPYVARLLAGQARVVGPADNCQYSRYTRESLQAWIDELERPDVVHWNNGLHDVGHNPERTPVQFPLEEYTANLEAILERLRQTTPHVIWATSTPVHPARPFLSTEWGWRNEEIQAYNAAALRLMTAHDVPVNDLYELVGANVDAYLSEDQLHLSAAGQKACGRAVAEIVAAYLPAN